MATGLDELLRYAAEHPIAPACDAFYFLRHGQTAGNAQRIFQTLAEPLNETGHGQARRAAQLLAGVPLATIVCSDAQRVLDTAGAVAATHGLAPQCEPGLRERNFGCLIGTSSAQIDWACHPEGGESLLEFAQRKRAALQHALAQPGPVLVVAHGGSLFALVAMLGLPIDLNVLGNAQPLRFERRGPTWSVTPLLVQDADEQAAIA